MLNPKSLGLAGGLTLGLFILVVTLLSIFVGFFDPMVIFFGTFLPLYSGGIIGGVIGFIHGFIIGYVLYHFLGVFYNMIEG